MDKEEPKRTRAPGGGRKPRSKKGAGETVRLYLRPDQIDWLEKRAAEKGLPSRSRVVSDWIDRTMARDR